MILIVFDVEKQTCNWKHNVNNCKQLELIKYSLPLLGTENPLCQAGELTCGTGECVDKDLFCDGVAHCSDGN